MHHSKWYKNSSSKYKWYNISITSYTLQSYYFIQASANGTWDFLWLIIVNNESTKNVYFHTDESIIDDQEIDYTKLCVMSAICIGTIFGNVVVILAIVARNIKVNCS